MDQATVDDYLLQAKNASILRRVPVSRKHLIEFCKVYKEHITDVSNKVNDHIVDVNKKVETGGKEKWVEKNPAQEEEEDENVQPV